MSATPSIPEFYAGRSIFITGGTGFMGKCLIEKLIRACPDIKRIYILIRPKKGKEAQERLDEILDSKLFAKVKSQQPDFKCKCVPITGDIINEGLGIDQSHEDILIKEVSVVFHSAATIKFDEEMKLSVQMNIVGVHLLLLLCKKMKKLEALVHISTAYANCDQEKITEEVYPPPLHPSKLLSAVEWMDVETLNLMTPKMIGNRPNTYTYTKAIAESLLKEESGFLPIAIVRPSIVGATYQEPVKGWVDNMNGPTGLLTAIGKGALRIMKGDANATADVIPVDLATNMLIAVGWYTATKRPTDLKIFHCTTGQINSITWGHVEQMSFKYFMKNPVENVARLPSPKFTKSIFWHELNVMFDQMIPAYLMDFYMWISGRRTMFVRFQDKLSKAVASLDFFTSHSWAFSTDNFFMLHNAMRPEDRKLFPINPKDIHWPTYMESYCLGIKQFILKEELSTLPHARKALVRLQRLHYLFNVLIFVVIWRLMVKRVAVARVLWNMILGWAVKLLNKVPRFARSS